ncbi:MAG: hypothetical protein CVU06_08210 [Bacteroidetes bacterium HGW-Bacteroidetes-22]|nr:MAG: hypothetical protein CVU06_08210 [Bacteroidetes bacterium HGW-Bacteroidetes-22]
MKKPTILFGLMAFILITFFTRCGKDSEETYAYQLQFLTENFKPLNYVENGSVTGLAPELLRNICSNLDIPFDVTVLPWDQAYSTAQTTSNGVLFSTILNNERKDLFKWAGPIISLDCQFYALSGNQITLKTLDDAKTIGKIGILKDYAIEQYLIGKGFTNLVQCTDNIDAFDKLLKGEIDLFPADKPTAEAALESLNKSIYNVTSELIIKTDLMYFAFNKNIPDHIVEEFQQQIDKMKSNGILRSLTQKYLNSSDFPGVLQVYTEQYPPLTFRNTAGEITGFGSDIVYEIMKQNNLYYDIRLSSWSNGYDLAQINPNFCLFTMDRTELRENLFQWVGPVGTNTTWIYTKEGSGITITSLEDARNLSALGTVSSWFSDQYLRDLGFTNLVSHSDPNVMAQKLLDGEIDGFVCTSVTFPSILNEIGHSYNEVVPSFSVMSSDYYIAFSKTTAPAIVSQWQSTLDAMKSNGTYDAIFAKWLQ